VDAAKHSECIIDQFSKQAPYFVKLPGHIEATQLLIEMAGIDASANVLDLACGAGAVACSAAKAAKHVTGIDLTPAMIEQAKVLQASQGLSNLSWQIGDVMQLPFEPDVFDVVLTRYSFHHFIHPASVLAEMFRVCKPGGRVAVADLVLPAGKIAAYNGMERLRDPSHVHVLTEFELRSLFDASSLEEIQCAGYLFELGLDQLLTASFPAPENLKRVRAIFEADIDRDELGIGVHRSCGEMRFAYPILILLGKKTVR
jgi:ubiquinone/menaquinone biosynthesis C-methylase UbiE